MAKSFEASGKTVDEAIDVACMLAGTTIENVEIEILDLGGKGLFGFGHKDARVRVTVNEDEELAKPAPAPSSTFGAKKPKSERKKPAKTASADIEIKPIIVIDPAQGELPADLPASKSSRGEQSGAGRSELRRTAVTEITAGAMEQEIFSLAKSFIDPIFTYMGVTPEYRVEIKDGILWIVLLGEKLGLLIGRRGETLNAIQYLVNLHVNRQRHDRVRLVLDVEGYRESREQTLHSLAKKMAEKAVRTGRRVELEPMNPHERRIVHIALQNDKRVDTSSYGEEPYRRVVVTSKRRRRRSNNNNSNSRSQAESNSLPNVIITHDTDE